jgi:choline dehydrogenase-like flavoprotein
LLIDAETLGNGSLIEGEIVIVGGGLAGITLARQLGDAGHDVVVLESGGEKPDERTQALYAGTMTLSGNGSGSRQLNEYPITSRVRCFGGSGNVWGGKCGPLDPMDFEKRAWIPYSGWPFGRRALQPYYDRACALLELPNFDAPNGGISGMRDGVFAGRTEAFTPRPRCYSSYTGANDGKQYDAFKRAAAEHHRIRTYLHANLTHIRMRSDGEQVESLHIRCLDGREHTARARTYVLATGGIENARVLLASNDVHVTGIGNHSDWLGRGFAGHSTVSQADAPSVWLMRDAAEIAAYDTQPRNRPHVVIGASDAVQTRTQGVNFTTTLAGPMNAASDSSSAVQTLAARLSGSRVQAHRGAYFMLEQTPNRSSRITLTAERDALGMPRVHIDMRYNALELDCLARMVALLARELGRLEVGRVRWTARREELIELMSLSRHHMGVTRMAVSPSDGVVDPHCRVHGVRNLYVAGSSVFPTSGIVNPTLTLLALAYRLGDHLIARTRAVG